MKKKIWIMNHYATEMYFSEGGRHYWFAENLIKKGYEPIIFCANTRHNSDDLIVLGNQQFTMKIKNEIPFVFVNTPKYEGNGYSRIKNIYSFYKNLINVAKKFSLENGKPDIILGSSPHPLTMLASEKIAKKFNVPCICEVRDLWPEAIFAYSKMKENSLLGRILIAGEHHIYRNADAMIFTKEGDTDYIKERNWDTANGGDISLDKCFYINNGIDYKEFTSNIVKNVIVDEDLNSDKFNVVYAGSIRAVNDVGKIVSSAKFLKEYEDVQFLIYGDGNEREKLEKEIRENGLTNVKMKGFINKQYIPFILSKSNVNILNYSQYQYNWTRGNSSNKLFEYMASGKPIISTVKMGYSIIEKYKCGVEIEDCTPRELADQILKIKNMPEEEYQKMCQNAKNGAKDFDFSHLTNKLENVMDAVLKEKDND